MAKYRLDPNKRSDTILNFEEHLKKNVIGQDEAIEDVVNIYQSYLAGMKMPSRPLGNLLFLGPTGVGKTLLVEVVADFLFGNRNSLLKINCAELQESHQTAKLVGAPHGYVGYGDTPMLAQSNIDRYHTADVKISVILFDEIEKANDALWRLLLGILDKGSLALANGTDVDFTNSFIFMTSNIGSKEISSVHTGYGFTPVEELHGDLNTRINNIAIAAALKHFSPEFINRLDGITVFNTLDEKQVRQVLELEFGTVQGRILLSDTPFVVTYSDAARNAIFKDGNDPTFGARHIKRSIEQNVVFPLTIFMSSKQVGFGDLVTVDYKDNEFEFIVEVAGATAAVVAAKESVRNALEAKDKSKKKVDITPPNFESFSGYV